MSSGVVINYNLVIGAGRDWGGWANSKTFSLEKSEYGKSTGVTTLTAGCNVILLGRNLLFARGLVAVRPGGTCGLALSWECAFLK